METVKNTLITLYSEIMESYETKENEFSRMRASMSFYDFIEKKLSTFEMLCNNIDFEDLKKILEDEFLGSCTKQRFINAIKKINKRCLSIMQYLYEGDFASAIKRMNNLMVGNYFSKYFNDIYANYIQVTIEKPTLYRMRDISQKDKDPDNCWHIPFNKRCDASIQRYNMSGYPCLYLADSKKTATKELRDLKEGKNRWVSEFRLSKGSIIINDLTIPSQNDINIEPQHQQLQYLLTYPLRLLCSIKVNESCNFPEEYIFPQFFFHWKYLMKGYICGDGFVYSSTKNPGGKNYVFPTEYDVKQKKQFDSKLQNKFIATKPELYEKSVAKKRFKIEITEL